VFSFVNLLETVIQNDNFPRSPRKAIRNLERDIFVPVFNQESAVPTVTEFIAMCHQIQTDPLLQWERVHPAPQSRDEA
jgi:hypothetical protein